MRCGTNDMSDANHDHLDGQVLNNDLNDLVGGFGGNSQGSEVIAQPGTFIHGAAYTPFTLNRIALSYGYMSYGLVQTAIDAPVDDAFRGGIEIECLELDEEQIAELHRKMKTCRDIEQIKATAKWARLYGGAGLIVASEQDFTTPLDMEAIGPDSKLAFIPADRWELILSQISISGLQYGNLDLGDIAEERPYNYYGKMLNTTRVVRMLGREAPSYIRQRLQGWGMSELERCMREMNAYIKFQNMVYELIDEAKIDVYKIQQFNETLASAQGTQLIQMRIQLSNLLKNYKNALVMDSNDDYAQKQIAFGGLADILMECRVNLCAAFKIPYNKLFGDSASGFSSGEDSMENYNALVEGDVREKVLPLIDEVVKLRMQQLFGFIPEFTTKFHPLRILNASEEEDVANKKQTRALNLYDRDLLSGQEVMESLQKDKLLNVESEVLTGARVPIGPMDANSEDAGEGKGEKAKPDAKKKDKAKDKKNSLSAFRELIQSAQVRRMNARKSAP
jgi:phage-related protein (TIGR01555 family)